MPSSPVNIIDLEERLLENRLNIP